MNYIVLFTNQKYQKNKKWKDGYAKYSEETNKFELYEEINNKKQIIFSDVINHKPLVGEILDIHNYLVDIDSVYSKVSSTDCSPAKQQNQPKVSICGGLKRRKTLQPSIKPLLTLSNNNTFINNNLNNNNNNEKNEIKETNEIKEEKQNSFNDIDEILQLFEMEEEPIQKEIKPKQIETKKKHLEQKSVPVSLL